MDHFKRRCLLACAAFIASVCGNLSLTAAADPLPAGAGVQPAPAPAKGKALEEIVVTAQKRAQNVQRVPISMTVITGAQIKAFNQTDLHSIEDDVPGLYIERLNWADTIYLRGFGSPPANYAFDPDVSLYVDGVYAGRPQQFGEPFFDVERVEVLRGPQGALFGKNTAAGAISVITANPTPTYQASMTGLYNFSLRGEEISGYASGPIAPNLGIRLAADFLNNDGYIYNVVTGDHNPRIEDGMGRLTLKYDPTPDLDLIGKFDYSRRQTDGENAVLASLTVPNQVTSDQFTPGTTFGFPDRAITTTIDGSVTGNWKLGPNTLTFITGYSTFRADRANTYSTDNPQWFTNLTLEHFTQFSQEIRLASPVHQTFDWIAGLYFDASRYDVSTPWYYDLFDGAVPGHLNTVFGQRARTYSAFGQGTYNITEALRLVGSLRYTHITKSGFLYTDLVSGVPIVALENDTGHLSEDHLDPSVTAQYDLAPNVMAYATYARGSKSGGFVSNTPGTAQADFAFNPERSHSYEIGIKSSWFDRSVLADVSLYDTTIENLQTSVFDTANEGGFITKNAGAATSKGVEAVLAWKATDQLRITWSGSYQDVYYDSFKGAECLARQPLSVCNLNAPITAPNSTANNNLAGYPLTYASRWNGSAQIVYDLPVGSKYMLSTFLKVAYRSRYYNSDDQSLVYGVQPSYAKVDLRVQFADVNNKFNVALVCRNLNDVKTYSFANAWAVTATPTAIKYLDEPRTVSLEATVRF